MKFEEIIHVSGLPGLFKVGSTRSNGIIVEDIDSGKSRFISVRKHQFTPLSTVSVFTEDDTIELIKIFDQMAEKEESNPLPSVKEDPSVLFDYFVNVLPDYDRERVMVSDVKKIIKWYNFLKDRDLYPFREEDETSDLTESE